MYKRLVFVMTMLLVISGLDAESARGHVTMKNTDHKDYRVRGNANIDSTTFVQLHVTGRLKAKKIIVKEDLYIRGNADLDEVKAENIDIKGRINANTLTAKTLRVRGSCSLDKTDIEGDVNILGHLKAENTQLKGAVSVRGTDTVLHNCQVCSLFVPAQKGFSSVWSWIKSWFMSTPENYVSQNVYLSGKTIVKNGISFEGERGIVYVSTDSQVLGTVKGGDICRKEQPKVD